MARKNDFTDDGDMMTTKEFAYAIQAAYPTVMRWVKEGRIPGAQLIQESRGPVWFIPRKALRDFRKPERGRPPKSAQAKPESESAKKVSRRKSKT